MTKFDEKNKNTIDEFIRYTPSINSVKTKKQYERELKILSRYVEMDIIDYMEDITEKQLLEYIEWKENTYNNGKSYQNSYKNTIMFIIQSLNTYLYKNRYISRQLEVSPFYEKKKEIITLSKEEVQNMFDNSYEVATKSHGRVLTYNRDMAILTLMLNTCIRVSELTNLNIGDLRLEEKNIKIIAKGGNERVLFFGDKTRDFIISYLKERDSISDDEPLFINERKQRIGRKSVARIIEVYNPTSKHITPHDIRRTGGRLLYEKTQDIYAVSDILGHKSIQTTKEYYVEPNKDRIKDALVDGIW